MVKRLPLVLLSLVTVAAAFLLHVPIATSQARFRGAAEIAACLRDPHCAAGGFDDAIFFAFSPQQAAAIARVRAAHAAAIVMLKADDPAQLAAGERTLGGPPQLVHVGLFPPAGYVRALRSRGIKVWANALAWERLCEPLRFLALTANVGGAQVVQTDAPRAYLRPPPSPPPPREAPREVRAAGAAHLWRSAWPASSSSPAASWSSGSPPSGAARARCRSPSGTSAWSAAWCSWCTRSTRPTWCSSLGRPAAS